MPVNLNSVPLVVSYSDGEGTGGIGVALWSRTLHKLVVAFMDRPRPLRRLWKLQRQFAQTSLDTDIFQNEALGPAIIFHMRGSYLQDEMWVHCIDNIAAQPCILKESSSCRSGVCIAATTSDLVAQRRCWLWCDRVESKSNPVDGLWRRQFDGPWDTVGDARLPPQFY